MEVLYHGIKTWYAYDFPLCFPHELILIWEITMKSQMWCFSTILHSNMYSNVPESGSASVYL